MINTLVPLGKQSINIILAGSTTIFQVVGTNKTIIVTVDDCDSYRSNVDIVCKEQGNIIERNQTTRDVDIDCVSIASTGTFMNSYEIHTITTQGSDIPFIIFGDNTSDSYYPSAVVIVDGEVFDGCESDKESIMARYVLKLSSTLGEVAYNTYFGSSNDLNDSKYKYIHKDDKDKWEKVAQAVIEMHNKATKNL